LNGHNLRGLPLLKRKAILAKILEQSEAGSTLRLCEHIQAKGELVFTNACTLGAEGIVSKLASAAYTSGRGNAWIKMKCKLQQEFVIGGFTPVASGGQGIGALLLGYYGDGETWLYYPNQPFGRKVRVARVAADGKLIAVEQRLTDDNVAKLQKGKSSADEVRDLLGPPWKVWPFPRMQRDIWEYRMNTDAGGGTPQGLYLNISPDGVVREIYTLNDPDNRLSECCAR